MTDIRLVQKTDFPNRSAVAIDWLLLGNGSLDTSEELATAVVLALGTDALAGETDTLPGLDDQDRRGWWGDLDAEEIWGAWPIGSRLWLLTRAKITSSSSREGSTITKVEDYIKEALQPFIANKFASRMDVRAERSTTDRNRIDARVILYRGPEKAVDLRYAVLWDEIGAS
jgi:phage gp46-like protein